MSMRPGDKRTLSVTFTPETCPDRVLTKQVVIVSDPYTNQIVQVPIQLSFDRAARGAGSSAASPPRAPADTRRDDRVASVRPTSNGP
jgi:hypothetical protein